METKNIVLQYVCENHEEPWHEEQPLTDIVYSGTLICPDCGDDMELEPLVKVVSA